MGRDTGSRTTQSFKSDRKKTQKVSKVWTLLVRKIRCWLFPFTLPQDRAEAAMIAAAGGTRVCEFTSDREHWTFSLYSDALVEKVLHCTIINARLSQIFPYM